MGKNSIATVLTVSRLFENGQISLEDYTALTDELEKLRKYEDLEKQGKLMTFPCKIGDDIWGVEKYGKDDYIYFKDKIQMIGITARSIHIKMREHKNFGKTYILGKSAFLSKEEAMECKK